MKYSYTSEWIEKFEPLYHWTYYWNQLGLILGEIEKGDRILEIGVGTRFVSNYLISKGYDVVTMDIDPNKKPDIVANVVTVDLKESYDYILAFEVFEHLPFEEFADVLKKLHRHCNKGLIVSVPRNEKAWLSVRVELPGRNVFGFRIATRRKKILTKLHYWEVDHPPVSKKLLEKTFLSSNFHIKSFLKRDILLYYVLSTNS